MRIPGSVALLLAAGVLAAPPQPAVHGRSAPAAKAPALVYTVTFKPVTDENIPLPTRRPGERLYVCTAEVGENGGRLFGTPRVLLYTGEEQKATTEQRGVRVYLRAALDGDGRRAQATVVVARGNEVLGTSKASFWLPAAGGGAPERKGPQPAAPK